MISKFTKGKPYSKSAQYSNVNPSAKSLGNQSNDGESNHAEGRGNELAGGDHARGRKMSLNESVLRGRCATQNRMYQHILQYLKTGGFKQLKQL